MEKTKQDLLLGLVFFAALGILLWATIELTGLSMLQRPTSREAVFPNAAGLRVGDNVFVLGHRLGQVGSLRLDSHSADRDARIRASLVLGEPIEFRDGYSLVIEPSGLLGGVQVQIDPGKGETILAPDALLRGSVRPGGLDAVGDLLGDGSVQRDVKAIVAGIREAIDRANRGEGTLGKLLTDPKLHDEFLAATSSAKKSLESIERGEGVFGRMIGDKSLGDAVADTVRRIDDLIQKLGSREGLLGRDLEHQQGLGRRRRVHRFCRARRAGGRGGRHQHGRQQCPMDAERLRGLAQNHSRGFQRFASPVGWSRRRRLPAPAPPWPSRVIDHCGESTRCRRCGRRSSPGRPRRNSNRHSRTAHGRPGSRY